MEDDLEKLANSITDAIEIDPNYDLTIIAAKSLKIHVSTKVMQKASRAFFRRMTQPGFKEGDAIQAQQSSKRRKRAALVELPEDPDGLKLYCAALHKKYGIIRTNVTPVSLLSFAKIADFFDGLAEVKQGAEIAMNIIHFRTNEALILRAAFLFRHEEYFGKLTDWMVKYRQASFADLQGVELGITNSNEEIYDLLLASQRRYLRSIERARVNLVNELTFYFGRDHSHKNTDRRFHRNIPADLESETCTDHQTAVLTCEKAMFDWDMKPNTQLSSFAYANLLHRYKNQMHAEFQVPRSGDCERARKVTVDFEAGLERLNDVAEDTFAGVCLTCFKAGRKQKTCDHQRWLAPCPYCRNVSTDDSPLVEHVSP